MNNSHHFNKFHQVLDDEAATVAFGEKLGHYFQQQNRALCVFLIGNLGAGKTTLSRGILRAFGHQGAVKSPTYTLVEEYEFASGRVNHFDLYRLGDAEELEYMGIRDYFAANHLCLIEWPERGAGVLPRPQVIIELQIAESGREIQLSLASELTTFN